MTFEDLRLMLSSLSDTELETTARIAARTLAQRRRRRRYEGKVIELFPPGAPLTLHAPADSETVICMFGPPDDPEPPDPSRLSRRAVRAIAQDYLRLSPEWQGRTIRHVVRWDDITFRRPAIYSEPLDLHECWVCYLSSDRVRLESSTILLVSALTGQVVYAGSANDEG